VISLADVLSYDYGQSTYECTFNDEEYNLIVLLLASSIAPEIFTDYDADSDYCDALLADTVQALLEHGVTPMAFPIGTVISNPSNTPDAGWLLCDGTQYNRADYPALAALIPEGTPNIGGDSTVFFVPNLTGRVVMGAGSTAISPATGAAMGTLGGSNVVGLGINDIPAHTHGYATGAASGATGNAPVYSAGVFLEPQIQTGAAGNGSAPTHSNLQPYFALYAWIYAGV